MVHRSLQNDGEGFDASVWVPRKTKFAHVRHVLQVKVIHQQDRVEVDHTVVPHASEDVDAFSLFGPCWVDKKGEFSGFHAYSYVLVYATDLHGPSGYTQNLQTTNETAWNHLSQDLDLAPWVARLEHRDGPTCRSGTSTFALLADCICSQQLSLKAAATIWGRVESACGGSVTPEAVLTLGPDALREAGFSRPKAGYLMALAQRADELPSIQELESFSDENVIEALVTHKGIGRWSAEMILIFNLGRDDIWPIDDLGVQLGVQRVLGLPEKPSKSFMQERAQTWAPYRSWAALLMWRVRDLQLT